MSEDFDRRYPVGQSTYLQNVGRLLPQRIASILRELGFTVWINEGQSNGVDLKIFDDNNNLLVVAEILNWSPYSELSNKRKESIISNLLHHSCRRLLVYTTMKNESILEDLSSNNVSVLKIGFQILPQEYYDFFCRKNQITLRRAASAEATEHIRSLLTQCLRSSGLIR
jgi:hypothetical protein